MLLLGSILLALTGTATFEIASARITDVILFGDSYTDQSRAHSISNGTYPGKDYQEIYPPADTAADGGFQWPFYLGLYGNYTIWNYAVGGAVCSNELTPPLRDVPDVASGQQAWFVQDHIVHNGTGAQQLLLDPASFVVVVFIGTNDLGPFNFVTNNQRVDVALPDVADCQLNALRALHALGARNFIVNLLIPLELTVLYGSSSDPIAWYPFPHNPTAWHHEMANLVRSLNRILGDGVRALNAEWRAGGDGAGRVEWFDTYGFFEEMYRHPAGFFNGSIPANVTGSCHRAFGDTCTLEERDSYMWWDELHPSEQTGRNLAAEMHRKIEGKSKY